MIEKIGLAGLLALWLAATGVSFVVTVICGIVLFDNLGIGILCGTILAGIVAVRAVFRIRGSIRQWQQRPGRVKS